MKIASYVIMTIFYKKIVNVVCVMDKMNIKINNQIVVSNMLDVKLAIF
jgi:hypothetical protein